MTKTCLLRWNGVATRHRPSLCKSIRTVPNPCLARTSLSRLAWALALDVSDLLSTRIQCKRLMPTYVFRDHFRSASTADSFHFRGRSCTTIHFHSASANISIVEIRTVVRNVFRVPQRFRQHWFSDPFRERLRGASALRVFTSARSSYFKPGITCDHLGPSLMLPERFLVILSLNCSSLSQTMAEDLRAPSCHVGLRHDMTATMPFHDIS